MEKLETIELECKDCKRDFEFSAGEQAYFKEHLLHPPKRCPVCRLEKKQRYNKINNIDSLDTNINNIIDVDSIDDYAYGKK